MSENNFSKNLLTGRVALVTGASGGIGKDITRALTKCGAKVIAVARREEALLELQKEFGIEQVEIWVEDATSRPFFERLELSEGIDILVNNVGSNKPQPMTEVEESTLDWLLDINVRALYRTTQIVVKKMLNASVSGSIINMSSQMGHVGSPNRTVYCMTKHAVEGLTKALAVEVANQGIRVNSVAPTFVETPMTKPMFKNPEFKSFVMSKLPTKQLASLEEVSNAVLYLASDLSGSVTGTSLKIDGGWTAE